MDIREYIQSGVLEAYWAGELNIEEMKEVDRLASLYPEIKEELDQVRDAVNSYGSNLDLAVNDSVLAAALSQITEDEQPAFLKAVFEDDIVPKGEKSIKKASTFPVWAVAASVLLVISAGFNFFFLTEFREARDLLSVVQSDLAMLRQEQSSLASLAENQKQELQYADLRIAHFLNKDNIHVRMDGMDISPESFANVFWNVKTNSVFISVDNLPEPPHGHQYQLWAIKAGQAPIDAGIFDHNQLVQELKVISGNVQAFAVTLEKEGGSPIATVDQTYVKGLLKKS